MKAITYKLIIFLFLISGCSTFQIYEGESSDPFEPYNRAIFDFNVTIDNQITKPIAVGYRNVVPNIFQIGINNFFDNFSSPVIIISNFLQFKIIDSGIDISRFVINSTVGVLGVIDMASYMGLEPHNEDLGQTLGKWGINQGPYLMMPLLGPYTIRDLVGKFSEYPLEFPDELFGEDYYKYSFISLKFIDQRSRLLVADREIEAALDPYILVREAYLQRRFFLVHDGNPPEIEEEFLDAYSEEEFFDLEL